MVETLVAMGLAKYEHADPFRGNLPLNGPFLLIPPCPAGLDLDSLVKLIRFDGKAGINLLHPEQIRDTFNVPHEPYLLLDIEDGEGHPDMKPMVAERDIIAERRSPYTLSEGIVHAIVFPEVLGSRGLDLCGSRYGAPAEQVPVLYLHGGWPVLAARWTGGGGTGWGAPSCGGRRGV
jgi:hypothetical protein